MKRVVLPACVAAGLGLLLCGCGKKADDVSSMSRADQEKAFAGDPVRGQQIGEQMKRKYLGNGGAAGRPKNLPPPSGTR